MVRDPAAYIPADNPPTAKIEFGRLLFFDKRLSKTNTVACAVPHARFGIHRRTSRVHGNQSAAGWSKCSGHQSRYFYKVRFWDRRAQTLEQSTGPFINPVEHGFLDYDEMTTKMKS